MRTEGLELLIKLNIVVDLRTYLGQCFDTNRAKGVFGVFSNSDDRPYHGFR